MYTKRSQLHQHFQEYATIYIFMIILFLNCIVFGAIIVNSMSFMQKQDLFFYLERFFNQITADQQVEGKSIFVSSFFYHIRYLLLLCLLGLSVIGLPLVWILLFLKGLVVGFSVGFIVNQLGMQGLLLASLAIAPQNLVIIPIYIIGGSLSMIFSLTLLGKLFSRKISQPIIRPFTKYMIAFSCLMIVTIVASFIEAFIANGAMQALIKTYFSYTIL